MLLVLTLPLAHTVQQQTIQLVYPVLILESDLSQDPRMLIEHGIRWEGNNTKLYPAV